MGDLTAILSSLLSPTPSSLGSQQASIKTHLKEHLVVRNQTLDFALLSTKQLHLFSVMSSFMVDLWESIFTPGPTSTLLRAANVTFGALQIVLLALLVGTHSIHFIVLSVLCAGLWWSINWFAAELKIAQEKEKAEKAQAAAAAGTAEDGDSDTEVDESQVKKGGDAEVETLPVEPLEAKGELRQRGDAGLGTQSSVSTEDEWEKVSESEQEKEKTK